MAAREFPLLVPTTADDPETTRNREAWAALEQWQKPFLTAFGDSDAVFAGTDKQFQQRIPGAKGQPHCIIEQGGHFLQEDRGEQLAALLLDWLTN